MVRGTGGDPQNSLSRRPKMEGSEVMTASKGKVISSLQQPILLPLLLHPTGCQHYVLYLLFKALNILVINQCDRLFDVGSMEAGTTPILVSLPSPASDVVFGTRWCWYPKLLPPPAGFQLTTCLPVTSMHITLHKLGEEDLKTPWEKIQPAQFEFWDQKV